MPTVLVLAFSSSAAFRIFFKLLLGIVVFGLLHGLVVFPAILRFVGSFFRPTPSGEGGHPSIVSSSLGPASEQPEDTVDDADSS